MNCDRKALLDKSPPTPPLSPLESGEQQSPAPTERGILSRNATLYLWCALVTALGWTTIGGSARGQEAEDREAVIKALQDIQDIVGTWKGDGKGGKSTGWSETIECQWKFNKKNGRVSLYLTFKGDKKGSGRILEEALVTYDLKKQRYVFRAYRVGAGPDDPPIAFEGTFKDKRAKTNLVLDRTGKGKTEDQLDRLDVKLLNEGDRLVYSFHRRLGKSRYYRQHTLVGLNRDGVSLAARGSSGPKCIVTGGVGTMTVSHKGKSYFVCCSGCRETFLDNPELFLAKLKAK